MIVINTGATANDGTGDKLRDAFIIVNQNFLDIQGILDIVLTDSSIIPISQISGLQTILDDLSYQVSLIPTLQDDINSINSTIFTINQTLNSQNSSINELYSLVNDLQQQIFTKIGEAPIDGQQYVRQDAEWVVSTGVTFSQLLENVTPDGYLGLRLQPASASNNGFYINKSTNQSVGYYVRNTDNVGNAAVSALYLGGSGGLYDNYVSLFHANAGYSIPYLRNNNGLISNNDLFFIGWQGASFNFVTSTGTFGNETSKFKITNSGTVSIGVQPTLDNDTTDILGRKADGTIVRIDKSSIGGTGSYLPLAGGTMDADADIFFANGSKLSEGIVDAGTGGNKGIALTCAVGYEFKWEAGELYLTDLSGNYIDVKDYARSLPTVNDDITKGFVSGSNWRIGNQFYQCLDPTEGAAVWVQETDFGTLQVVTDNGNVTTNQINIYSDTNGLFIKNDSELNDNLILAAESIITFNDGGIVRKSIIDNQTLVFTKDSISKTISAGTYNTDENTILILPDKASGSYTFAMIDDIPTKTSDLINDGVEDAIVNGVIDKAPSQNAVFDALDLTRRLIVSNTGSTVTGTVAETILTSMVVSANTLDTVCDLFITLDYNKNTANAIPMKLYYNTSNSLAGATQISFYNTGSNRNGGFNRKFVVKGTSMDLITTVPTFTQLNNQFIDAIFAASTVITIAPTGNIYFIFTVANDAVGTTFINKRATVEKMKLS